MSNLMDFIGGNLATTSLVNRWSDAGASLVAITDTYAGSTSVFGKGYEVASTTTTSLTTVLDITSSAGEVSYLNCRLEGAVGYTIRAKVTVDGVVVFDSTSGTSTVADQGMWLVGYTTSSDNRITFNDSFKFEVTSTSFNTTNVLDGAYKYILKG